MLSRAVVYDSKSLVGIIDRYLKSLYVMHCYMFIVEINYNKCVLETNYFIPNSNNLMF